MTTATQEQWGQYVTVHCHDLITGVYTGMRDEYVVQGTGLPPECHEDSPPVVGEREAAVFTSGNWKIVPDWRGISLWSTSTGEALAIDAPGVTPTDVDATEQPRPSAAHVWRDGIWVLDQTLADQQLTGLRDAAIARVNSWRDAQEQAPLVFEHAGRRWDAGLRVRDRLRPTLNAAKQAGGLPPGFFWTDADNADVPMTVPELELLAEAHEAALVAHGWKIHARQRVMKQEIETLDEVALSAFVPTWGVA